MQIAVLLFSLLAVGSLALPVSKDVKDKEPLKKVNKYPKKYSEAVHGADLKVKDKTSESSYLRYELQGSMDALRPPPPSSDYIYMANPRTEMFAPTQDTYSSYEGLRIGILMPPLKEGQTSADLYLGYTEAEGKKSDDLDVPELSSYDDKRHEDAEHDISRNKDFSLGLRPPKPRVDASLPEGSSYFSLEAPSVSPYFQYNKENSGKTEMRPPSTQSDS